MGMKEGVGYLFGGFLKRLGDIQYVCWSGLQRMKFIFF